MTSNASLLDRHARIRSASTLLIVLGDQLDRRVPVRLRLDRKHDAVLMTEVLEEAEHAPSHRQRTVQFLAAMRHHAIDLVKGGYRVRYVRLDSRANCQTLTGEIRRALRTLKPARVVVVQPGDLRVEAALEDCCANAGYSLEVVEDASFTCTLDEFNAWADDGRKRLTMEYFYRERRRVLQILVDDNGKPEGGQWNFDEQNRESFSRAPSLPTWYCARPDDVTREVMGLVERTWPDAYGRMEHFHWPVTPAQAKRALDDFIDTRLACFGTYEDAMWAGEATLYHSRLSGALNLKLIDPMACIEAAIRAYKSGAAALNNVEGFVRQIIGWREFMRGVYYREGRDYLRRNGLGQQGTLPNFFWTGHTDLNCLHHCISEVVDNAWGHHIPRLMVIGNFALLAGVHPGAIHGWFLGMYVDGVDWVTAPNVLGMSQYADHGVVATKPYVASGRYIRRMSNYCEDCAYDPKQRRGEGACPFNILYWDFLLRNEDTFAANRRMAMMLKNASRLDEPERRAIRKEASRLRQRLGIGAVSGG